MRARFVVLLGLCTLLAARPREAHADEQRLVLMREPSAYTDVIDAFDGEDNFDLNVHLSYERTIEAGTVQREHTTQNGMKRGRIADSERTLSQLMLGVDVGLYKDVMAFLRAPLVLGDQRALHSLGERGDRRAELLLHDPGDFRGGDGTLFTVPLTSPTRAGFDYFALGGAIALTNQERKPWLPTWVVSVEGRRATGTLMRPCRQDEGATRCGATNAEDLDGDGEADGSAESMPDNSGASRGVSALVVDMRASKRFRYVEPYLGLSALVEWASTARRYFSPSGDLKGYGRTNPSRQASATLGAELIPWEHRGRFQRVGIDVRLLGTYFTEGKDYSALYDALGTSDHAALARPQYEGVRNLDGQQPGELAPCSGADGEACYVGEKVSFYGLTDLGPRLKYGARLGFDVRAARYVRFVFGTGFSWMTAYPLTSAEPCNTARSDATRSMSAQGMSCAPHPTNPAYRASIDSPGRRFWMTEQFVVDIYAAATAQF